jgi:rhodanese-related sulfurtransferase
MLNQKITPDEIKLLPENTLILDVRTTAEFKSKHLDQAINLPLDQINQSKLSELKIKHSTPIVIVCQSGKRAEKACQVLNNLNYLDLKILEGGISACSSCNNLNFIEGKGSISLERQVRIAAGSFVVIGVVLGQLLHSGFYIIPAFVGTGLVFSGVTDTCGLALVLSKMPWNQK